MRTTATTAGLFGTKLRVLRKAKGLTLEQLARKIKSHKGYVSGIENGKVNPPSPKVVKRIAAVFGEDPKPLLKMAWADKAPLDIREEVCAALFPPAAGETAA